MWTSITAVQSQGNPVTGVARTERRTLESLNRSHWNMEWKVNGMEHHLTTRYHPQSNGEVERFNRVIKESIIASLVDGQTFDQAIHTLLPSYRSTLHSLTGKTPAELMIPWNSHLPLGLLKPPPSADAKIEVMAKSIAKRQQKMKEYADKR